MSMRSAVRGGATWDVVVLGAGPAGSAAALGLARLGYRVAIVSRQRPPTIEGFSARSMARLAASGLNASARCATPAAPRWSFWAGERGVRGEEYLVARADFDRGLRIDLEASDVGSGGVESIDAAVIGARAEDDTWRIDISGTSLRSRTVLDARGRRARRAERCGPPLAAWTAIYRCAESSRRGTAVVALHEGWCWLARTGNGLLSLQYVGAANERFTNERFGEKIAAAAIAVPELGLSLDDAVSIGRVFIRAAVARYSRPAQAPGYLRIGDAAIAMDPLSGNGVYEALGSAQVAVAAINTYLSGAEWPALARFVDERADELWRRSVAAARDFYRLQAEHSQRPFWQATASAYERLATDAIPSASGPGRFELRPVLNGQRIEVRSVWVSAAWPRGIWRLNGRELADAPADFIPVDAPRNGRAFTIQP